MKREREINIFKRSAKINSPINVIQTRSKKIKTVNNLLENNSAKRKVICDSPSNIQTRSKKIKTVNNLLENNSGKRKAINDSSSNIIQTRSNKIKTVNNLIKNKSGKRKSISDSSSNIIWTQRDKIEIGDANNLLENKSVKRKAISDSPSNIIRTQSDKIKTHDDENLLEPKCIKSEMTIHLQYLPDLVLETIFQNLTYHEIATLRIICRRFNEIGKILLNKGFRDIRQYISKYAQKAEDLGPSHFMLRVDDFADSWAYRLYDIDCRLTMLELTFRCHILAKRCCFFPGQVLDAISDIYSEKDKDNTKSIKMRAGPLETFKKLNKDKANDIKRAAEKAMNYAVENIFPCFKISVESTSVLISSSTPPIFIDNVLKSILGDLELKDLKRYLLSPHHFAFAKEITTQMLNQLKMLRIKDDNPIRGLDRCLVPEKILGSHILKNRVVVYLVRWKGEKEAEFVYARPFGVKFHHITAQYHTNVLHGPILY